MNGWNQTFVLPDDLLAFAWSAPMRDLAARVGMSDAGLKKLLRSHGVVTPPQGYWNRVHAGKPVSKRPNAPARRPGQTGRVAVGERFAKVLPAAEPLPSAGPFASAVVPEDLDELNAQELSAIGRATVRKTLDRVHPGLAHLMKQEQRRREKFAASRWSWDAPKFDSRIDQRRLRILNGLFMALTRSGHSGDAYERDGELHATAIIGDTRIGIEVDVAGKAQRRPPSRGESALPASTPLAFSIDPDFDGKEQQTWQDDADGRLESKVAEIAARTIVAGEAKFRRGLKEAEERAEQYRRWEEQRRQEQIVARNAERLTHLRKSCDLLRQAGDLRSLIGRVRDAVSAGSVGVDQATLQAWQEWASAEADRLDPLLSGQIMTHLATVDETR